MSWTSGLVGPDVTESSVDESYRTFLIVLISFLTILFVFELLKAIARRRFRHQTFERIRIPGPKPHFIHGHLYETRRQPYTRFAHKMHEIYGKNVGIYLGGDPYLITKDLELIQQVFVAKSRIFYDRMNFYLNVDPVPDNLICQRGDRWRYMRRLLTPAFTNKQIRSSRFYRDTQQTIIKFMNQLAGQSTIEVDENKNQRTCTLVDDVYDRMAAVALDVIIKTAFHMDDMISFDGPLGVVPKFAHSVEDKLKICGNLPRKFSNSGYFNITLITILRKIAELFKIDSDEVISKKDAFLDTTKRACRLGFNPLVELIFCFPFLDKPLTYLCNQFYFSSIIKLLFGRLDYLVRRQPTLMNSKHRAKKISQHNGAPTEGCNHVESNNPRERRRIIDSLIEVLREKKITRSEFTGNAFVIVFAGFETTANALTFTLWLLAKHQRVQTKLRQELLEKMANLKRKRCLIRNSRPEHGENKLEQVKVHGGEERRRTIINHEDPIDESEEDVELVELALSSDYLEWTVNEALRLYPPVPGLSCRQASETCQLANGLTIEKGVNVCPSVFSIHRDTDIWGDQAAEFIPERFSLLDITQLNSAMFMPFGFGPRNCIGKALALHELKIAIGRLVMEYSIEFIPNKTPEKLRLCSPINITITSADKIGLKFVKLS